MIKRTIFFIIYALLIVPVKVSADFNSDEERKKFTSIVKDYEKKIQKDPENIKLILAVAEVYYSIQEYSKAIKYYTRALELDPQNIKIKALLALAYLNNDDPAKSHEIFSNVLKEDPENVDAISGLGRIKALNYKYVAAEKYFQEALKINPEHAATLYYLADLRISEKRYKEAEDILQKLLKTHGDASWAQQALKNAQLGPTLDRVKVLEQEENYESALSILLGLYKKDPENVNLYLALARVYTNMKKFSEAVDILNAGIKKLPDNKALELQLGFTYLAKNDLPAAEYVFEKAIQEGYSKSDAKAGLGRVALLRGDREQAESLYHSSLLLNNTNILALSYLADLMLQDKNYRGAIEIYNKILSINPQETFVNQSIQNALMRPYFDNIKAERDPVIIKKTYEELLKKFPRNVNSYINFSHFYRNQRNYVDAIDIIERGLLFNPGNIALTLQIGFDFKLNGEFEKAIEAYNNVLAIQPQNTEALAGIGQILALLGDEETAEKYFLWVLKIDPNNETALAYLIDLKMQQKKYSEVRRYVERILTLHPRLSWAQEVLIRAQYGPLFDEIDSLEKEGNVSAALKKLQELQVKAPESEKVALALGSILMKQKRYQEAIDTFERGLEVYPNSVELQVNLGLAYLKISDVARSQYFLSRVLRNNPNNADAIAGLGKLQLLEGRKKEAETLYLKALETDPSNMLALSYLADFYMIERKFEKAEELYKKIIIISPKSAWAEYALKESQYEPLLQKGEQKGTSQAISIYLKLIEEFPKEPDSYVKLADLFLKLKKPKEAIFILHNALIEIPNSLDLKNELGFSYLADNNLAFGKAIFEEILKQSPGNAEAIAGLGRVEELSHNLEKAIARYKRALSKNPANITALSYLADLSFQIGKFEEAKDLYEKLAKLQPGVRWFKTAALDAKHGLLLIEIKKLGDDKDYVQEEILLQQLLREEPNSPEYYSKVALFYHRQKKYQKAIETYLKGIKVAPSYPELYSGLGLAYLSFKQKDKAEEAFKKALKIDPRDVDGLAGLGVVMMLNEKYSESEELIRSALYIDPNRIAALSAFGDLMMKEKRFEDAKSTYEHLLTLLPTEKWVKFSLDDAIYGNELDQIRALVKDEQFSEVADLYRGLLSKSPDNSNFYYGLGDALVHLKEYDNAVQVFQEGLEKNPEENELRVALGSTYIQLKRILDAQEQFTKALEIDEKNVEALAGLGQIFALNGDVCEAENFYLKALSINPKNLTALTYYGDFLLQQRRFNEAQEVFSEIIALLPKAEWAKRSWQDANDGNTIVIANRLSGKEEFELAIPLYRQLIALSPTDPARYLALGQTYINLQRYATGLDIFYRGLEVDPEASYLWRAVAFTYIELEDYNAAQCIFAYLIQKDPDDAESWAGLARIQTLSGSYCVARNYLDYALTLGPKNLTVLSNYGDLKEAEHFYFSSLWAWEWIKSLAQVQLNDFCDPVPKWIKRGYNNALNLTRPVLSLGAWYHEEDEWDRFQHRWSAEYLVYGERALLNYPIRDGLSIFGSMIDQMYVLKDLLSRQKIYSFDVQRLHVGGEYVFSPCLYAFGKIGFTRYSPYHRTTFNCQTHTITEPSITFVYHSPIQKATLSFLSESDLIARNFEENRAKLVGYDIIGGTYEAKVIKRGWIGFEANATWYRDYVNNQSQRALAWFQWRPPCYSDNILFRYFLKCQRYNKNIPDYYTYKPQIVNQLQVTLEKKWRISCADSFYTSFSYGHGWQNTRTRFSDIIVIAPTVTNPPIIWDNRQFNVIFGSLIYKYNCLQVTLAGDAYRDSRKYTIGTIALDVAWRF